MSWLVEMLRFGASSSQQWMLGISPIVSCESSSQSGSTPHTAAASVMNSKNKTNSAATLLSTFAFPEHTKQAPLTPQMDEDNSYGAYKWGNEPLPVSRQMGSKPYMESEDNKHHEAVRYPWPVDGRTFHHNMHPETDRINLQYSNMQSDHFPEQGYSSNSHKFGSKWERLLASHHGLPCADKNTKLTALTEDEIRSKVNNFSTRVHHDDPNDACKYLAIEEYKCLLTQQFHMDSEGASQKCVKWFVEWLNCRWDAEKMDRGITYIEDCEPSKRKPYIGVPDFQYS